MDAPWRIVPAREAWPATAAPDVRARGWLRGLLERLRASESAREEVGPDDAQLHPIQEARLQRLAPPPPIASQHAAIDAWRQRVGVGVVVRPDDGGWDQALGEARPADVEVIAPPRGDTAPSRLPDALAARLADPAPLHLTRLEAWFVRHHDGLSALRRLLAVLRDRRDPWTADVTPWAWGWIARQLPEASALPGIWAPAPLGEDTLEAWLGSGASVRVRGSGASPDRAFFRALAIRSHGSGGAARAIWAACLRDGAEEARQDQDSDTASTVWVRAPADVDLPDATMLERTDLLVVHALLLHGPSTTARLERSLDGLRMRVAPSLHRLASWGFVEAADDDAWRPRPEAVPALDARLTADAFVGAGA